MSSSLTKFIKSYFLVNCFRALNKISNLINSFRKALVEEKSEEKIFQLEKILRNCGTVKSYFIFDRIDKDRNPIPGFNIFIVTGKKYEQELFVNRIALFAKNREVCYNMKVYKSFYHEQSSFVSETISYFGSAAALRGIIEMQALQKLIQISYHYIPCLNLNQQG